MKLEIARASFLIGALVLTSVAVAAWQEPRSKVFSKGDMLSQCASPRLAKAEPTLAEPDHDLLLFLFGMHQGLRPGG